ncbi:unnamed protein product [Callosobruchus maculatus]|uniref:SOS1/NGEF-like PH domain-containing protein n=1 Tax=Callosobruchus maculatus TaxID=64391 RepID=A0A653DRE2_CALMS|nr:unnamed protein product [Callosobruchus maculatus]
MSNDCGDVELRRKPRRKSKVSSMFSILSNNRRVEYNKEVSSPCQFVKCEVDLRNLQIEIQDCPFDVTGYGCLILKDRFRVGPQKKKVMAFLFEKIIILNTIDRGRGALYYYGGIKIKDLGVPTVEGKALILNNFTKSKYKDVDVEYYLKAKSEEVPLRWSEAIKKCLWKQLLEAKRRPEDEWGIE